ncbi:MAG: hypothetical protein LBK01_08025, partial [Burkholderiaceae bacterium]|nr:hypothetical protein [Burkholderiaceae bacterium]
LQIPLLEQTMRRTRETTPQSALAFNKRRKNIRHAFSINRKYLTAFTGKHVGVVDDVMTTGETMREAAVCLKRAGAARVTCLVFARTPP